MIINLIGTVEDTNINFDLTPVYFEKNQFVNVNEIAIQWKEPQTEVYGTISSTLVDLSSVNLDQQIIFFHQHRQSKYLYYSPTHVAKYKIQCPSLQASVFNISLSEKHEIARIYLQLEITNARV